jgi:DNA helicase-2/ATP-dependent DNA helicase PcrA
LNFSRDFPKAKVIKLEQNYRSTKNILANANSLISYNESGMPKKLWTDNETGEKLEITEVESDREEGDLIARKIREKMQSALPEGRQMRYSDFAVLYRMNAQSRSLEEAFMRHQIPYQIIGGTKFFSRKEIKDVLAYLRLILNPKDDLSFLRIINFPSRKIGKSTIQVLKNFAENYEMSFLEILEHVDDIEKLPDSKKKVLADFRELIMKSRENFEERQVSEILQEILDKTKLIEFLDDGTAEGESRAQNVREIFSVTSRYDTAEDSLASFLEGVALIADVDNMENKDAVTMMTMHSSKGLEFPHVFLPGWEEGIFPSSRSLSKKEDLEEERRLGYVAITRAQQTCSIFFAEKRLMFGQIQYGRPSPFLDELDEKCCERISSSSDLNFSTGAKSGLRRYSENPAKKSRVVSSNSRDFELMNNQPKTRKEALFGVTENETGYQTSDKIAHASFGEGTIVMVNGDTLTVAFPGIGLKKISASVAPIEKI